jgi:hypothetical protein
MRVFLGGVAELYQGDLDLGRQGVERLAAASTMQRPGVEVLVEELHYGAVAVAQRLQELCPDAVVLFGAVARGRTPGSVHRHRITPPFATASRLQEAVGGAVTGYVGLDLVVQVAGGLGALPDRTTAFEVEPEHVGPGEGLSAAAARGLDELLGMVRAEVARVPVLELGDRLRQRRRERAGVGSPASTAMDDLLAALDVVDAEGRWGMVFACRDRLRLGLAEQGGGGGAMTHEDWALWWAMLEELDRLQAADRTDAATSS